jgi:hypothetical protein
VIGYNPRTEELEPLKGDVLADTPGLDANGRPVVGKSATINITQNSIGRTPVRYKDFLLECDVYKVGDELMVHLYCPRCRNALRVSSDRKSIDYDHVENVLSIEPFECTWELGDREGERMGFGIGLCRWRVGISKGVAKDA